MFTGIIEETGKVLSIAHGSSSARISVAARTVCGGTKKGDSIALNGVCLTVTGCTKDGFTADLMEETLLRSSLGELRAGSRVNLERALTPASRLGGHMVSGHIDGTGTIESVTEAGIARVYRIDSGENLLKYIVEKGSVAVDGISLTVCAVSPVSFCVSVIPHTAGQTNLSGKQKGDTVNVECDMIAKYCEKLLSAKTDIQKPSATERRAAAQPLSESFLRMHGF